MAKLKGKVEEEDQQFLIKFNKNHKDGERILKVAVE